MSNTSQECIDNRSMLLIRLDMSSDHIDFDQNTPCDCSGIDHDVSCRVARNEEEIKKSHDVSESIH